MKKFNTLYEILKFPIKLLFVGYFLLGISTLLMSDNFAIFYTITNQYILGLLGLFYEIGIFIVVNFPLIIVIKLVSRKTNSYVPILSAIVGYGVYLTTTMIFADTSLPAYAYSNIMNINDVYSNAASGLIVTKYPIQSGLIAALIVGFATRASYKQSRKNQFTLFNFIDKDILAIIYNICFCIFFGFIISILWPLMFDNLVIFMEFIAEDISNPMNLFLYGVTDKVLSILGMSEIIREPFWNGVMGGSWLTISGENVVGDVNVYNAMINQGIYPTGFGRLISPYYVLNMFVFPAIILAFTTVISNKMKMLKILPTAIFAILLSIFTGSLLPIEVTLLFLAPLLLFTHILFTGAIFSILQLFNANLGFSYTGSSATALPGTLFDFAIHLRNPDVSQILFDIFIIGVVFFIVYYFAVIFYFRYLAIDMFQTGEVRKLIGILGDAIGGYHNIYETEASPFRLIVKVKDPTLVDRNALFDIGTDRITETSDTFTFMLGKKSIIFNRYLKNILKNR